MWYNDFIKAMLDGNIREMNAYMNRVAREVFSVLIRESDHPKQNQNDFIMDLS